MKGTLKRLIVITGLTLLSAVSMSAFAQIDAKPDYQVDITASNSLTEADTLCTACDEGQEVGVMPAVPAFEFAMPVLSGAVELTHHNGFHAYVASEYTDFTGLFPEKYDKQPRQ